MKIPCELTSLTALAALVLWSPLAFADTQTTKETEVVETPQTTQIRETTRIAVLPDLSLTRTEGKVARIDPEGKMIYVRTPLGKAPIGHHWTEATPIVDLDGKSVDRSLLKLETPVEVTYMEDGNELIASHVLVRRYQVPLPNGGITLTTRETLKEGGLVVETSEKTSVTQTNLMGTLRTIDSNLIIISMDGQEKPVQYRRTETTKIVSVNGTPFPVTDMKAGAAVQVMVEQLGPDLFVKELVVLPVQSAADSKKP